VGRRKSRTRADDRSDFRINGKQTPLIGPGQGAGTPHWVRVSNGNTVDEATVQQLQRHARPAGERLNEEPRPQAIRDERRGDVWHQAAFAPGIPQRAEHRAPAEEPGECFSLGRHG
jgi:hypothetical protein